MDSSAPFRLGIDLGGTKTEAVLLDPEGASIFRERRATPLSGGYRAVLESVARVAQDAAALVPCGANYTVGVGIPGSVD
jgi:fructokinase